MARKTLAQQREEEAAQHKAAFAAKPSLPRDQLEKLVPGCYVRIKWADAADEVVLVTEVDRNSRKRLKGFSCWRDPESGYEELSFNLDECEFDQVLAIVTRHQMPKRATNLLIQDDTAPKREPNERERANWQACKDIEQLYQMTAAGLVTLGEFLVKVRSMDVPDLQPGDIEPCTGLRM